MSSGARGTGNGEPGTSIADPFPVSRSPSPVAGIPRPVKGLALVSLFNDFASEMVYPLLPAFVTGTLGGNPTILAALDGAADLTAAATKWVSGGLADRPGWRKPLIIVGYFAACVMRPIMALASAAWQVVGLRVLDRVGKGMRTPARDALIAEVTRPALHGRAFGFHRAADHFGSIPGALLAWWLLAQGLTVSQVLAWSVVPGIVAVLIVLVVLRSTPDASARQRQDRDLPPDAVGRVFWPPVLALAALVLLRLPETLLLLRLQHLGVAVPVIPLVWAGLHVVRTAVSYPGGWLADHLGSRTTVAAGGVCFAILAFVLGGGIAVPGAVSVFLALGMVAGLTESAERAMVARLAPRRTGRAFGAYHAVTGVAALPAALIFGALYQHQGAEMALRASAGGMILATLVWLAVAPPARIG